MKSCDLCGKRVSETVHIPIKEFQQAVRDGFNPFKIREIDTSGATGPSAAFGISVEKVYEDWLEQVLADTTDWGLCSVCLPAYQRATGRAKKWWQFWK